AGLLEQRIRIADALVRHAAEPYATRQKRIEGLDDAGIEAAANEEVVRIAARKRFERRLDERLERVRAARCSVSVVGRPGAREGTANELVDAVADPRARIGLARRGEAERLERPSKAVGEVRYGVDEGAVEIEGDDRRRAGCRRRGDRAAGFRPDQKTRTAISAGAASSSSSSLSRRSSVSDAPAISSDVQYSPT